MVTVCRDQLPSAFAPLRVGETAQLYHLAIAFHRHAVHLAGVRAVIVHLHARGNLVIEGQVAHGALDNRLEACRYANHRNVLLMPRIYCPTGLFAHMRGHAFVIEIMQEGVHLCLGLAGEGAEHQPTHPCLALRQAQLVCRGPQPDAQQHRGIEHAKLRKMLHQHDGRVPVKRGAIEIERGKPHRALPVAACRLHCL